MGLILSVIALVWQVFTWRLTGSVVRVKIAHAYPVTDKPRFDHPLYSLTATNIWTP